MITALDHVAVAVPDAGTNEDAAVNNIDVVSFATDVEGDALTVTGASATFSPNSSVAP